MSIRKSFTYEGQRYFIRAKDEKDFEVKKALKIRDINENVLVVRKNVTCSQWANNWPQTYRSGASLKTQRGMKHHLDEFCKVYGKYPLSRIANRDIQAWANTLAGMGKVTYNGYIGTIRAFFETALDNNLITSNPAERISPPKVREIQSRRPLTAYERKIFLKVADEHPLGMYLKFMLYCGLRTMEVAALDGVDVDLKKNIVHVRRNVDYKGKLKDPKTPSGVRDVPIVDSFAEELKKMNIEPFKPVFTTPTGLRYTPSTFKHAWDDFRKAIKKKSFLGCDFTPYNLRHTFCTDLQDAGVPLNVAKVFMGHSSIKMTATIYTHHTEVSTENARTAMNEYACHKRATKPENVEISR